MATTCGAIRLRSSKATLASIVAKAHPGIRFNEHIEGDGPIVFPCLQDGARRYRVEAEGLGLPFWPLARLTQDEESGGAGGEARSGGGLGALTAPVGTFSAASHRPSTLRSPAFASSMIVPAIIASLRPAGRLTAARAVSKATPTRRVVSGSKVSPFKKSLMATGAFPSRQAEP